LAFTAGLLIRPTTLFLIPILPIALILACLVRRDRRSLKNLAVVALMLVASAIWAQIATAMAFTAHDIAYRSSWGRGTIEAVQRIVKRIEAGTGGTAAIERTALIPAKRDPDDRHLRRCQL
jgi:4-amino-4-deoxy-L-arabinose transferase-like glycosyltransferase